jgi:hypothetical protein
VELTLDQKLALFTDYEAANEGLAKAEEALKAAKTARSAKVKAILEAFDGKKGPYELRGKRVFIADKGGSFFFRAPLHDKGEAAVNVG